MGSRYMKRVYWYICYIYSIIKNRLYNFPDIAHIRHTPMQKNRRQEKTDRQSTYEPISSIIYLPNLLAEKKNIHKIFSGLPS